MDYTLKGWGKEWVILDRSEMILVSKKSFPKFAFNLKILYRQGMVKTWFQIIPKIGSLELLPGKYSTALKILSIGFAFGGVGGVLTADSLKTVFARPPETDKALQGITIRTYAAALKRQTDENGINRVMIAEAICLSDRRSAITFENSDKGSTPVFSGRPKSSDRPNNIVVWISSDNKSTRARIPMEILYRNRKTFPCVSGRVADTFNSASRNPKNSIMGWGAAAKYLQGVKGYPSPIEPRP